MNGWKDDKRWSDRFLPEIKRILGEHLIGEPPIEEDQERNTDLIVLKMEAVRIACRIRRNEYLEKYPNEFTIRTKRPTGIKTEIEKIIEGWGDYLFYGFSNKEENKLAGWFIISLNAFRLWFMKYLRNNNGKPPGHQKINSDGSSAFAGYNVNDMPDDIVFKKYPI